MPTRNVFLFSYEKEASYKCAPYIIDNEPIEYICDGKEGSILFDGYYYVEDHPPPYPEDKGKYIARWAEWLPKKIFMNTKVFEKDKDSKILEDINYIIEVYKREMFEKTDVISEFEEDGVPTNKQRIYFRVLESIPTDN
jgi:hypothetical protein